MRGPFMPAEAATGAAHWAQPFLALLSDEVKLAGPYISCERGVHVQGPFQVTDRCCTCAIGNVIISVAIYAFVNRNLSLDLFYHTFQFWQVSDVCCSLIKVI